MVKVHFMVLLSMAVCMAIVFHKMIRLESIIYAEEASSLMNVPEASSLINVEEGRSLINVKEASSLLDVSEASFLELLEGNGDTKIAQDDPRLIKYVREHYLIPPSKEPLHISNPKLRDPAFESESETVLSLLEKAGGEQTGGFFVEAGAWDGEKYSTTLMFERFMNWTGLLIEAHPGKFENMKKKNRNAWISNAGLSIHPYPEKIAITGEMLMGKDSKHATKVYAHVQTIPLWTLLLAIGQTEIDFLSLDVELLTQPVLRTVPLDKVNIKVAMIETVGEPDHGDSMKKYLEDNDFTFHKYHRTDAYKDNRINDIIMYKNKTD